MEQLKHIIAEDRQRIYSMLQIEARKREMSNRSEKLKNREGRADELEKILSKMELQLQSERSELENLKNELDEKKGDLSIWEDELKNFEIPDDKDYVDKGEGEGDSQEQGQNSNDGSDNDKRKCQTIRNLCKKAKPSKTMACLIRQVLCPCFLINILDFRPTQRHPLLLQLTIVKKTQRVNRNIRTIHTHTHSVITHQDALLQHVLPIFHHHIILHLCLKKMAIIIIMTRIVHITATIMLVKRIQKAIHKNALGIGLGVVQEIDQENVRETVQANVQKGGPKNDQSPRNETNMLRNKKTKAV